MGGSWAEEKGGVGILYVLYIYEGYNSLEEEGGARVNNTDWV